jgi:hypothetical protein
MKTIFATLAIIAGLVTYSAAADTDHSANYFLPSCRDFVSKNFAKDPLLQGQCIGMIEALATFANDQPFETSRSCPPENATIAQLTTVVVRWIDQRPQRWHENFLALVLFALHDAWPCK